MAPQSIFRKERLKRFIRCIMDDMSDPFYQNVAPGLAYYFLLSIAPIVISFSYLASFFLINSTMIIKMINRYLPEAISRVLIPFISQQTPATSLITTIIFIVFTLYLSSRGVYMLIKISDYAADCYSAPTMKDVPRIFFKRHFKAVILTLLMMLIIMLALVFMVFGRTELDVIIHLFDIEGMTSIIYTVYYYISYPIAAFIIFIMLIIIYSWMPTKRLKLKDAIPGAILACLGIILSSLVLMVYIGYFFSRNMIYGALSSIILLILWFFLLSFVLIFGIIANHAFMESKYEDD